MNSHPRMLLIGLWAFLGAFAAISKADSVEYQRDVRPILTTHCFPCHGPDADARQADLRLDQPLRTPRLVRAIRERIRSADPEQRMPPPDKPPLSDEQMELLSQWSREGAKHQRHWAFQPPHRPLVPQVRSDWPRNPIDAFVLQALEARGLRPSPVANPATLTRRLHLLTTGLPPESGAPRTASYSDLIDRLLASPAFGERMAQNWLDAARYADTMGHAADRPRTMWLYRDWVIDALNRDQPFDEFTIEQLAGDMLPSPTPQQRIATGFHRNSMQALGNNPRKEEFRVHGIVDRLDTTGRVWLGLTLACAECHDHKYDPISTREYYQLFAIFNNIPHLGEKFDVHGPRLEVLPPLEQAKVEQIGKRLNRVETKLANAMQSPSFQQRFNAWSNREPATGSETPPIYQAAPVSLSKQVAGTEALDAAARRLPETEPIIAPIPAEKLRDALTLSAWIKTTRGVGNLISNYDWRAGKRSLSFGIGGEGEDPKTAGRLHLWLSSTGDPFQGVTVAGSHRIDDGRWRHVAAIFRPASA